MIKEIHFSEAQKIYPLIKQLRPNLNLDDFLKRFKLTIKTQNYKLFAYENENTIQALCGVMPFNVLYHDHCLYICDFIVDENIRSKGLGQAFLQEVLKWAKLQGYKEIELSSSFFREKAHEFYVQKMNFNKTGFVFKKNLI